MRWPGPSHKIEELVEANYGALYRYAFRLSGSAAEAEDLTQDAFCQAQANLRQLREWDKARAWLFTILRNAYLHRMRDRKIENSVSLDCFGDLPDRPNEPLQEIDPGRLQDALDELPEVFRTPVILFYFEEFSYRDIADQMGVPIGTIMSRLARAKAFLRGRLMQMPVLMDGNLTRRVEESA